MATQDAAQTSFGERPWRLDPQETPPLAAHLVTKRTGYTHHGIYLGNGKVAHYAGLSRSWLYGPVEEVSLAQFARERAVSVQPHLNPRFSPQEIVTRALSRLGENDYRIASNNCEHFCEWCVQGESRSRQIEALRRKPGCLFSNVAQAFLSRLRSALSIDPWNNGWAV
jgi:HRAS-like suppressor 3